MGALPDIPLEKGTMRAATFFPLMFVLTSGIFGASKFCNQSVDLESKMLPVRSQNSANISSIFAAITLIDHYYFAQTGERILLSSLEAIRLESGEDSAIREIALHIKAVATLEAIQRKESLCPESRFPFDSLLYTTTQQRTPVLLKVLGNYYGSPQKLHPETVTGSIPQACRNNQRKIPPFSIHMNYLKTNDEVLQTISSALHGGYPVATSVCLQTEEKGGFSKKRCKGRTMVIVGMRKQDRSDKCLLKLRDFHGQSSWERGHIEILLKNYLDSLKEEKLLIWITPAKKKFVNVRKNASGLYRGKTQNALSNGMGTLIPHKGTSRSGNWKNGILEGPCQFRSPAGVLFKGSCRNDRMAGKFHVAWPDGRQYSGILTEGEHGLIKGYGSISNNGRKQYQGNVLDLLPQGKGTYYFENGSYIRGSFKNGQPHGLCKRIEGDGTTYEGPWKNGKMDGDFLIKWPGGDTYRGTIQENTDGNMNGRGTITKKNGTTSGAVLKNNQIKYTTTE